MAKKDKKSDQNYTIVKKYGQLDKKLVAKISWYDKKAKYDIRKCWEKDGELKIGTGISLSYDELKELQGILNKILEDEEDEEPDSDGRTPVNLEEILSSVPGIVDKRNAGYTTEDGFVRLRAKPGHTLKLKPAPKDDD